MFKNYIKIALRTLWRDRAFSIINLVGLVVGLASVLMIVAYVRYELSYDRHYSNAANIYRISIVNTENGVQQEGIWVPSGLAPTLKKEFPSIIDYTILIQTNTTVRLRKENVKLETVNGTVAFFKVFNLKFVSGEPASALKDPNSIVLTKSTALKFFPEGNAIGKTIDSKSQREPLKVTGVIEDIPANTHFKAEAILSQEGLKYIHDVLNMNTFTSVPQYVLLNKNSSVADLEKQFKSIYKKYNFPKKASIKLLPVTNIHLYSHTQDEFLPGGDIKYIYIFLSIALLILLIACINYINLNTARSIHRAHEIGVRKVLGAAKKQLIFQFLSESFLFFTICLILGVLLANVCWPRLSVFINMSAQHIPLFDVWSVILIPVIILLFGLLSGIYPALILSKVKTSQVLKGVTKFGINISLRKVLVAAQFVISGVLIISTIIIYQQLNFINNARLGYNKEHLITVPFYMYKSHVDAFKNELKTNANIKEVAVGNWETGMHFGGSVSAADEKDSTKTIKINFINADPDFVKTMGIEVVHGRDFSRSNVTDMLNIDSATAKLKSSDPAYKSIALLQSYIFNEEALKILNIKYKDNLVLDKGPIRGTIVGVVKNFNALTLHDKIPAIAIKCTPSAEFGGLYIRVSPANTQESIAFIQKKWSEFYPDQVFQFSFVDDKLQQLYSSDKRVGQLFGAFAVLAIIIACLGLFGLISLTVQQRVKEIGIRKVLGASVANITTLLSSDFLKLVIIAMLVASPIAWYVINKWLQDFAYHIQISWWVFLLATVGSLFIVFITVSFQSIKAAMVNPVKSLKNE